MPIIPQGTSWDVCSRFVLNCTPTQGQKLPSNAKIECGYKQSGSDEVEYGVIEGEKDANGKDKNIVIKANRLILGIMDKTPVQNTVDGEELVPLKIKVSTQARSSEVGNIENVLIPFTTN